MKLVSIIVPTHGGGEYLKNVIDSILLQDYENIEVIVVDDNGRGLENQLKTENVIKNFKLLSNFKYIIHDTNLNGSAARNTGARFSKGEYIGFIDDDDTLMQGKIRFQVEQLESLGEEWGASYSSKITKYNGKVLYKTIAKKSGDLLYKSLNHKVSIGTGSMLIRRNAWNKLGGYDETFIRHQDWEFVARLASQFKIAAAPDVFFERNFTFRHGPKSPEDAERFMNHFLDRLDDIAKPLSARQRKIISTKHHVSIALKYLRNKNFKKFFSIYRKHACNFIGIWYMLKMLVKYPFLKIKKIPQ